MAETRNAKTENSSKQGAFGWIPTLTAFVGVLTFLFSAVQFSVNQAKANREPFLRKQMEVAFKASEAVAILASSENPKVWEQARSDFWMLYWGPLSIVEDQDVKDAMMELGGIVPPHPVADVKMVSMPDIQTKSYRLAKLMRTLMLKSWGAELPVLTDEKPTVPKP